MTWRFYAPGEAQPVMEMHLGLDPLARLQRGAEVGEDFDLTTLCFALARLLGAKEIDEEFRDDLPLPHHLSCQRCGEMPEDCECPCPSCGSLEGYCTCPEPGDA